MTAPAEVRAPRPVERTEAPKFSGWKATDYATVEGSRFTIRLEGYVPDGAVALIAAAPDLLAACRVALESAEIAHDNGHQTDGGCTCTVLRSAIAAASEARHG